jgi:hypothetical protein
VRGYYAARWGKGLLGLHGLEGMSVRSFGYKGRSRRLCCGPGVMGRQPEACRPAAPGRPQNLRLVIGSHSCVHNSQLPPLIRLVSGEDWAAGGRICFWQCCALGLHGLVGRGVLGGVVRVCGVLAYVGSIKFSAPQHPR